MRQEKKTLLLVGKPSVEFGRDRLPRTLQSAWALHYWIPEDGAETFAELSRNADAVVGHDFGKLSLRDSGVSLFQIPFAGYDWLRREHLPPDCVVCNVYEHETPIAEYVMLNVLEWEIRLHSIDADFRAGSWRYFMPLDGPYHGEAQGKTLGLVGYGHIAQSISSRAAAFGMRTVAVVPKERPLPPPLDWIGLTGSDLARLLEESDYVVLTCPLNKHTRHLIAEQQLARMKSSAVLINIARGHVVHEEALYKALHDRVIRGASIDTWYQHPVEPGLDKNTRPSKFPFHELNNIFMTPHCSAWTYELIDRRWTFIAANLDRFAHGEPLQNILSL